MCYGKQKCTLAQKKDNIGTEGNEADKKGVKKTGKNMFLIKT